jgi:UDP:flavonoid glycosyltransferase YjiC (YdhE family)/uncharacterized protein (DUF2141 family)
MRKRILFVAESVTLAQVVRLVSLARALDESRYELHFASASFAELAFAGTTWKRHRIHSISPEHVAVALRRGRRLYSADVLASYVRDDLALFDAVKPDLVVGDFRLSLSVSAPHFGVPYAALANAYWSPYAKRRAFPLPDHPMVSLLGEERAARYFPTALPYVFAHFARPVNGVRKAYGLPPIGSLPEVLTHGDYVMYADTPGLVPTTDAPATHSYIGPVFWSPAKAPPAVMNADRSRPWVYVTLGSSGEVTVLPTVIEALAPLPVTVLVATAGRTAISRPPANTIVADFVPGDWAARRSALVISNGGSSTGYQALAEGVPVLGIASNLDQFLAMTSIAEAGAGTLLRASTITVGAVRKAVMSMLGSAAHRERAQVVQRDFGKWSFAPRFGDLVARITGISRMPEASPPEDSARARTAPAAKHRSAPSVLALAVALATAVCSAAVRADTPSAMPVTNEIRFSAPVEGNKGHVICALFRREGWLKTPVQWKKAPIRDREAECIFTSVAPDVYAISAFHDENDNEKLDTNFIGIPTESWCTSRDAKAYFGPPSFDDAKFRYTGSVMRQRSSLK